MFLPKFSYGVSFLIALVVLPGIVTAQTLSVAHRILDGKHLSLPQRDTMACSGSAFIKKIDTVAFERRETMIVKEILNGNIPSFLRLFCPLSYTISGNRIEFYTLSDYLAIGSDSDFVRIPMGPLAAQEIADELFCSLPTSLLVDKIAFSSQGAIEPFPFRPLGERNTLPIVFEDSNNAINALYKAKSYVHGQLISGLKKDVILTSKITDTARLNHVTIYGWHYPNGTHIQPSNNVHINSYVDYSHGIRLIYRIIKINGAEYDIQNVLSDPKLFMLLSNEPVPMSKPTYAGDILH
ncbi:MAG: hypothetical protein RR555_03320 [Bacteroidales bacterium]